MSIHSRASPCCGGGGLIPSILFGDDRAQLQVSLAYSEVIGDAPASGLSVFRAADDDELTQTFKLEGAYRIYDRIQLGATIPVLWRSRSLENTDARSSGLGDTTLSIAYEFLPQWSYSSWAPQGFVFLRSTFPTSPSIYDSIDAYQIDVRGRGFFELSAGVVLFKAVSRWDFMFTAQLERPFARTMATPIGPSLELIPGFGASTLIAAGFSPGSGNIRFGLSLSPEWQQPLRINGAEQGTTSERLVWNTTAQINYLLGTEWTSSMIYTDQTFMGPAKNTSLSRSIGIALQKRWEL